MQLRTLQSKRRAESNPSQARSTRKPLTAWMLLLVFCSIVVGLIVYGWLCCHYVMTTGRVVASEVRVTSTRLGRIVELPVQEGEEVSSGQLLARLADDEIAAELKGAEGQLDQARARLTQAEEAGLDPSVEGRVRVAVLALAGAREAEAASSSEVRHREEERDLLRSEADRREKLFRQGVESREAWETKAAEMKQVDGEAALAREHLAQAEAQRREAEVEIQVAKDAREFAKRMRESQLAYLRQQACGEEATVGRLRVEARDVAIVAPRPGVVSWVPRKPGEVVRPGDALLTLVDRREMWVEAYVEGADLRDLREGQSATVLIGSFPDVLPGKVFLSHPTDREPGTLAWVGALEPRYDTDLSNFLHPVRILLQRETPRGVQPEMLARVKIARR